MTVTLNMTAKELLQLLTALAKMPVEEKDKVVFNKLVATIRKEYSMWGWTEQ